MEGLEALIGVFLGAEPFLEIRQEDPGFDSGFRILEPLEQRSEGTVRGVPGLLALIQELVH